MAIIFIGCHLLILCFHFHKNIKNSFTDLNSSNSVTTQESSNKFGIPFAAPSFQSFQDNRLALMVTACKHVYVIHHQYQTSHFMP